jgi:hypothetical protein
MALGVYTKSIAIAFGWMTDDLDSGLGITYIADRKRMARIADRLSCELWNSAALLSLMREGWNSVSDKHD